MILLKNLYGDPGAGRRWSTQRDEKLRIEFNTKTDDGQTWTCKRTLMDPCLFYITLETPSVGKSQMLVSIHTDDLDVIGSDDDILGKFYARANKIWTLKITSPDFMLGINRIPEYGTDGELLAITVRSRPITRLYPISEYFLISDSGIDIYDTSPWHLQK